jgi:Fe-S oxidoreductase
VSDKAGKRFDLATQGRICVLCPNMCRYLCPVASVEKTETTSPRGKATLALGLRRGEVAFSEGEAAALYHCATCKICREWCPSNVDLPEVTRESRERAAREGMAPPAVRNLAERLVRDRSLHGPAVALAAEGASRYRQLVSPGAKVLYFAGCSTAALQPGVVAATLRLFEAAGVKAARLQTEECCGLPLDVFGFREEAAAFARGLAAAVEAGGYQTVVSGCPMCTQVMKERYPALGVTLGADVRHVAEYFAGLAEEGALGGAAGKRDGADTRGAGDAPADTGNPPGAGDAPGAAGSPAGVVTYHDPCYLGRYQGVYDPPRRLLTGVAGLALVEMERHGELAACCGGALTTDTVRPGTATSLASRRSEEAGRTGAGTLVTACPHCLEMLGPAGADRGIAVRDITEVLAERLGVLPRRSA